MDGQQCVQWSVWYKKVQCMATYGFDLEYCEVHMG